MKMCPSEIYRQLLAGNGAETEHEHRASLGKKTRNSGAMLHKVCCGMGGLSAQLVT